jgi:transposase-like protein
MTDKPPSAWKTFVSTRPKVIPKKVNVKCPSCRSWLVYETKRNRFKCHDCGCTWTVAYKD